jgi:serine/threonine protein kinase
MTENYIASHFDPDVLAVKRPRGIDYVSRNSLLGNLCSSMAPLGACKTLERSSDLFEFVNEYFPLERQMVRHIFRQVVNSLHYLHSKSIMHGDIKDENVASVVDPLDSH